MEDHFTSQCPKPKDHKVFSECSVTTHSWIECTSTSKKCLNCRKDHSTLTAKCSERKDIIKQKRANNQNPKTFYSQATKTQPQSYYSTAIPNNCNGDNAKIFTCIMHGHLQNIAEPCIYNTELNKLLTMNNLPNIDESSNPSPAQIINKINNQCKEEDYVNVSENYYNEMEALPYEALPFPLTYDMLESTAQDLDGKITSDIYDGKEKNLELITSQSSLSQGPNFIKHNNRQHREQSIHAQSKQTKHHLLVCTRNDK